MKAAIRRGDINEMDNIRTTIRFNDLWNGYHPDRIYSSIDKGGVMWKILNRRKGWEDFVIQAPLTTLGLAMKMNKVKEVAKLYGNFVELPFLLHNPNGGEPFVYYSIDEMLSSQYFRKSIEAFVDGPVLQMEMPKADRVTVPAFRRVKPVFMMCSNRVCPHFDPDKRNHCRAIRNGSSLGRCSEWIPPHMTLKEAEEAWKRR